MQVNGLPALRAVVEEPHQRQLRPTDRGRFLAQQKRFGMTVCRSIVLLRAMDDRTNNPMHSDMKKWCLHPRTFMFSGSLLLLELHSSYTCTNVIATTDSYIVIPSV